MTNKSKIIEVAKLIATVVAAAFAAAFAVVVLWVAGPVLAALLVGTPLWLLWNWLGPIYFDAPTLPYMHVAAAVAGVVLLKRLLYPKQSNSTNAINALQKALRK